MCRAGLVQAFLPAVLAACAGGGEASPPRSTGTCANVAHPAVIAMPTEVVGPEPVRPQTPTLPPRPDQFENQVPPNQGPSTAPDGGTQSQPSQSWSVPEGWPATAVDAASLPIELLDSRCAKGSRGNWVCVWGPGSGIAGGPCSFAPDGSVLVAGGVWWPDYDALGKPWPQTREVSTVVIKHAEDGTPAWARVWHRSGDLGAQIAPEALVVDDQGNATWGGEVCVRPSPHAPSGDGGYYDSCLDAFVATIDTGGDPVWQWSFGTSDGLERVSDLLLGPDRSLYLAGSHSGPLELPGQPPLASHGGIDHYLMRRAPSGDVTWARDWGSAEHDGDDVRLAPLPHGAVALSAHSGLDPTPGGLLAIVDPEGQSRRELSEDALYISRVASLGDDLVAQIGGAVQRVDADGRGTELLGASEALGTARMLTTSAGTLLIASQTGDRVLELDANATILRSHHFEGPASFWYQGGFCASPDGRIAISATIDRSSTFGILDEPLDIDRREAFLLVLNDW